MESISIQGIFFDGVTARATPAVLTVDADGMVSVSPSLQAPCGLRDISVSASLGNTPRHLRFANGALFETQQHAAVNALLRQFAGMDSPAHDRVQAIAHVLERNWLAVLASLAGLVLFAVWFAIYGAPLLARHVAFRLPAEVSTYIGRDGLQWLDRSVLQASTVDEAQQRQLQTLFETLLPEDREGMHYRLVFRSGKSIGPNAFALPDATVLITDDLVKLADNHDQLAVVLLHEIGHVKNRHMLRQLLQQSGLAALLVAITGDVHGASSMVVALPGVLMQAQYSQQMEWEADTYALDHLQQHRLSPLLFAQIMRRMESWKPEKQCGDVDSDQEAGAGDDAKVNKTPSEKTHVTTWQYLSSHPATADRIKRFEDAQSSVDQIKRLEANPDSQGKR